MPRCVALRLITIANELQSNGVRFSISDLSPRTARIVPTVFQDRSSISLYDAQHSTGAIAPISPTIIEQLLAVLLRFKWICQDFDVPGCNIRVLATEATRNAINREELLQKIKEKTGWDVLLLTKEEEGRLGAMGIASSVAHLDGICMDMGGGSVQLTWMTKKPNGHVDMGPSISFPYGAAALMSRLSSTSNYEHVRLAEEMVANIRNALEKDLQIPLSQWGTAKLNGGFNLYLSGGGFRGVGHSLMSKEMIQPYPISIINGYIVSEGQSLFALNLGHLRSAMFRISKRRASQAPAVSYLIQALREARLPILHVTFVQGGVREGLLYSELPPSVRVQNPLVVSTTAYAPPSAAVLSNFLRDAVPYPLESELLEATVNLLYYHSSLPKDIRAAAALRCTTTGVLAGAHGLSHRGRCLLALILCERWGGDISDVDAPFFDGLQTLCGPMCWWARFIGRMARGIAELFPAGIVRDEQSLTLSAGFPSGKDVSSVDRCWVQIIANGVGGAPIIKAWARRLEKLGKKKSWGNGKGGLKVEVVVTADGYGAGDENSDQSGDGTDG